MAIKAYNPTTPARRGMTSQDLSDITTRKPLKSLVKAGKQRAGRNNTGAPPRWRREAALPFSKSPHASWHGANS